MPIEAIATKQNPRSTTAGLQRSILRIVVCWSRRPNKVMAVNRIGTSSNKITCRPFSLNFPDQPDFPEPVSSCAAGTIVRYPERVNCAPIHSIAPLS